MQGKSLVLGQLLLSWLVAVARISENKERAFSRVIAPFVASVAAAAAAAAVQKPQQQQQRSCASSSSSSFSSC